ncbi:MAG: DUF2461 domain-containing protein [Gammaproteobacteria bacterium]|nr:DUF2461 domain-containing protein [Gammaproteobacteria bacterium]
MTKKATPEFAGFPAETAQFLSELAENNQREWFKENKHRYERHVLEPALEFINAMNPRLEKISRHFVAIGKRTGGSLMRVYRDTRFSKNKTPYKTNVGIQFRHELGKDVHAPGFYLHIQPKNCFLGTGIWRPDSDALAAIRNSIAENPGKWKRARDSKRFVEHFRLGGDRLKRPPRGFAANHPFIEDLKRKDFIAVSEFPMNRIRSAEFIDEVVARYATARPLMKFLCAALDLRF